MSLGESTFYRLYNAEREQLPQSLLVRFEGVPGEFAQFDFGVVDVRLLDGRRKRVHFAAYRLKHSRWMSVVLVPDERVESLIRSLLTSFEPRAVGDQAMVRVDPAVAPFRQLRFVAGQLHVLAPEAAHLLGPLAEFLAHLERDLEGDGCDDFDEQLADRLVDTGSVHDLTDGVAARDVGTLAHIQGSRSGIRKVVM